MSDEEIEHHAQELQAASGGAGPKRKPPPWAVLTERSREFWRAKVRAGQRAQGLD